MAKIEASIVINRPVETVFAAFTNIEKWHIWQPNVLETKILSEGPKGLGTTYMTISKYFGHKIESKGEVILYEENVRASSKLISAPFPFKTLTNFESVEGGTKVTGTVELEIGGFFSIAEGLVLALGKRQYDNAYNTIKDLLEADAF